MNNKVGRNDPCACGSGKKYKKCCEAKHKHKKFEAKVLSSSSSILNRFFNQSQSVSSLFNRQIMPMGPRQAAAEEKKGESKEEASPFETVDEKGEDVEKSENELDSN